MNKPKKSSLKDQIIEVLEEVTGVKNPEVEFSSNEQFGDYSSNIALKDENLNPQEIADKINKQNLPFSAKIAGKFINFWLEKDILIDNLIVIDREKENYGKSSLFINKKINFEFGQPNTHKLPHIGHLFSYILGYSLTNILEFTGARVYRVNYQGDIGPHVAKCLWAFQKEKPNIPDTLVGKIVLLQQMYQKGSAAYETSEDAKLEIDQLNKLLYLKDKSAYKIYVRTRKWSVDYYKSFEKRLDVKYDRYYFESEVEEKGREGVEKALGKVFKISQGAIIFEGSKYGLHDRVFVTKHKTPTYEAKDTYLEVLKYKEWPYDLMVITTANEQNEYFKVVYKAIEQLEPKLKGKLFHIGFGMVNLSSGKMSSRTGRIVGAVDLLEMAKKEALKINKNQNIAEAVAVGAVKYAFLKSNPLQNIKFNVKESVSLEGNSGPYLQYTVARCSSVIQKGPTLKGQILKGVTVSEEETLILRKLSRFSEVVANAAKSYSPNILCTYLYELASLYNTFYNKHKIIGGENEVFKLLLTKSASQVLKNGLTLLGIKAPERM